MRRGRAGDGMVHTVVVAGRLRGRRSTSGRSGSPPRASRVDARRRRIALRGSGGAAPRAHGRRTADDEPLVARASRDPGRASRSRGSTACAHLRSSPTASRALLEEALGFEPRGDGVLGGARRRRAAGCTRTTSRPPSAGSAGAGTVHHVAWASHDGGARGLARARRRRRHAADADHRPLLVPVDLLPRAERRAVRDRDARPGLLRGRGPGAPGRDAHPPAGVRAPACAGRARSSLRSRIRVPGRRPPDLSARGRRAGVRERVALPARG